MEKKEPQRLRIKSGEQLGTDSHVNRSQTADDSKWIPWFYPLLPLIIVPPPFVSRLVAVRLIIVVK